MGVSSQRHAPAAFLPPGKGPPVTIVQEAGWAPEPVWTQSLQEKSFRLCRGSNPDRPVVQSVVRHYTAWANRLPEVHDRKHKWKRSRKEWNKRQKKVKEEKEKLIKRITENEAKNKLRKEHEKKLGLHEKEMRRMEKSKYRVEWVQKEGNVKYKN
jgi:hypothetical protein